MENSIADKLESQVLESEHIFMTPNRPITLKFEDVVYKIKAKEGSKEREILKGISGIVTPGEMLAILGPSGSGKTTLLTALGGRLGGSLAGNITYNNRPFSNNLKRTTGFVTQDDVHYPNLTVTETLVYTALLRLPNTLTAAQKTSQAESVIHQLSLEKCKDSVIGGPFLRGVSGGERKRVSIGQEMLINPSLLLLDEPTSGLDSTTAQKIVSLLAEVARSGTHRAVLVTIHQPSSKLFYMFNKVLLLCDGSPLYFGRGDAVMDYFCGVGFAPLVAMNPADFLVDLANGVSPDDSVDDQSVVKSTLTEAYKSNLMSKVKLECEELDSDLIKETSNEKQVAKWATTWYQQFTILLQRGLRERKHQSFSKLKIMQILAITLLSGLLWWKSKALQDQTGLLFFYSAFWSFFPMFQAILSLPPERLMLTKERSSGTYRLSPYFMAQMVSDLPMELLLPTASLTIVYFMAGLKHTPGAFFYTLFVLLLNVMVSQGLGLALGAVFMDQKKAIVLGTVLTLGFQLAGGFYVQNVPSFISWIKYVSIMQYSYKLMLGSQYSKDDTYPCGSGSMCLVKDFSSVKSVGLGMQLFSAAMLLVMFFLYRGIAYVSLMRVGAPPK